MNIIYPTWYVLSKEPNLDILYKTLNYLQSNMAYLIHHTLPLEFLGKINKLHDTFGHTILVKSNQAN